MEYKPNPISISSIKLSQDLLDLTERLAENVHNLWAEQRLAEGWKYGPYRNDATREHPGLRPYAELADSEKEYDRKVAMGSVKAILALGYRINRAGQQ
jgi:hypothetical protein